jgi:hypothetical protein
MSDFWFLVITMLVLIFCVMILPILRLAPWVYKTSGGTKRYAKIGKKRGYCYTWCPVAAIIPNFLYICYGTGFRLDHFDFTPLWGRKIDESNY